MVSQPHFRFTPEEYLTFERRSEIKHEYLQGEVFAMAGASYEHNQITANVARALGVQLGDRPCDVLTNDMRVSVPDTDMFTYPDVVVVCGEPRFTDDALDTLINPTVIVEVLSTSTEGYDRGLKFAYYRTIASLTDYVLIAQDRLSIEHYVRQEDGTWRLHDAGNQNGRITLASVGCELNIAAVYRRVNLAVVAEDQASEAAPESGAISQHVNSN